MKAGYPPIDIKFTDRAAYNNAFDAYHVRHDLSKMEGLFAGYINTRLDTFFGNIEGLRSDAGRLNIDACYCKWTFKREI